jgi:hypothetical protein
MEANTKRLDATARFGPASLTASLRSMQFAGSVEPRSQMGFAHNASFSSRNPAKFGRLISCGESKMEQPMITPPKDRLEIVLMADQAAPIHLWVQSTVELARRIEFDKEKSVRVIGGVALFLILMLYFFRGATAMLLLLGLMVIFPLKLVGMAGYFRGT